MYKLINSNNYQQRKRNLALKNIYEIVNNKMDIKKKKKTIMGLSHKSAHSCLICIHNGDNIKRKSLLLSLLLEKQNKSNWSWISYDQEQIKI